MVQTLELPLSIYMWSMLRILLWLASLSFYLYQIFPQACGLKSSKSFRVSKRCEQFLTRCFMDTFERQLGSRFHLTAAFRVRMNHFLLGEEGYKWITIFELDWQLGMDGLSIFLFFLVRLRFLSISLVDCQFCWRFLIMVPLCETVRTI